MAKKARKTVTTTVARRPPPPSGGGGLILLTDRGRSAVASARRRGGDLASQLVTAGKPAIGGFGGGLLASLVHPILPDKLGPTGKAMVTVAAAIGGASVLRLPPSVVAGMSGAAGARWYDANRSRRATDRPATP